MIFGSLHNLSILPKIKFAENEQNILCNFIIEKKCVKWIYVNKENVIEIESIIINFNIEVIFYLSNN